LKSARPTKFPLDEIVHADCRYFRGDRPCDPHKRKGVHCDGCPYYDPVRRRILIIKLGAVGDVIRTTPLLRVLKRKGVHITWLTHTPDAVPHGWVDRILALTPGVPAFLQASSFDEIYNLDKDLEAVALCKTIPAEKKFGFTLSAENVCVPVDRAARAKWLTGLFDDLNRLNSLSYPQEIFALCGQSFRGEKYLLELDDSPPFALPLPRPRIGLNTGAGSRWPSRIWKYEHWKELTRLLLEKKYGVLLLGGPEEDEKNQSLAAETGAFYAGTFPLRRFYHLVNEVDLLVTGVTLALHVGIGLGKRIVLLNSIFNRAEFELYGLGRIVEPNVDCLGCFRAVCPEDCINQLAPEDVFKAVQAEVRRLPKRPAKRRNAGGHGTSAK
jgi:heptosyltransferase-2